MTDLLDDYMRAEFPDQYLAALDAQDEDRIARLRAPGARASAAQWYGRNGIAVFPLEPQGKKPLPGSHGFKDATTEIEQIAAWWAVTPEANIGLPTGQLFDVIDIDGPTGFHSWIFELEQDTPPVLAKVATPRGLHLYIAPNPEESNGTNIVPGIDYRGLGGYVVAPPSINADGKLYTWQGTPADLLALANA